MQHRSNKIYGRVTAASPSVRALPSLAVQYTDCSITFGCVCLDTTLSCSFHHWTTAEAKLKEFSGPTTFQTILLLTAEEYIHCRDLGSTGGSLGLFLCCCTANKRDIWACCGKPGVTVSPGVCGEISGDTPCHWS